MNNITEILRRSPVVPVVVIELADRATGLARALLQGGIDVIEITLRTPAGLAAIESIRSNVPEMCVGAGTVWTPNDVENAVVAGASFLVSPGSPPMLLDAVEKSGLPYLPGVQTVTEAAAARERGYAAVKFFPAEAAGGISVLKAMCSVLPELQFCPTGGLNPEKARDYLALDQVPCVGGTWLAPAKFLAGENWRAITELARQAAGLGQ